MFMLKLVHLYSGITRVFEDICYDTVLEVIDHLPRHENGYDGVFELVPEAYDPRLWEVRFDKVSTTVNGVVTQEIEDFRPLAEDR